MDKADEGSAAEADGHIIDGIYDNYDDDDDRSHSLRVMFYCAEFGCSGRPGHRGVNLGDGGDTSPQNLEWGTPMYNVPPDFDIFSVFSLT